MKVRTHITIEKETLAKVEADAKSLGLSISSYLGLLIPRKRNARWFTAPSVVEAVETVIDQRDNGIQKKIEKALGCGPTHPGALPRPEQFSLGEGVDFLIARLQYYKQEGRERRQAEINKAFDEAKI